MNDIQKSIQQEIEIYKNPNWYLELKNNNEELLNQLKMDLLNFGQAFYEIDKESNTKRIHPMDIKINKDDRSKEIPTK